MLHRLENPAEMRDSAPQYGETRTRTGSAIHGRPANSRVSQAASPDARSAQTLPRAFSGHRITDALELEVRLGGLTKTEQARMVACLSPKDGPGTAKLRLKATIGAGDRIQTQ